MFSILYRYFHQKGTHITFYSAFGTPLYSVTQNMVSPEEWVYMFYNSGYVTPEYPK